MRTIPGLILVYSFGDDTEFTLLPEFFFGSSRTTFHTSCMVNSCSSSSRCSIPSTMTLSSGTAIVLSSSGSKALRKSYSPSRMELIVEPRSSPIMQKTAFLSVRFYAGFIDHAPRLCVSLRGHKTPLRLRGRLPYLCAILAIKAEVFLTLEISLFWLPFGLEPPSKTHYSALQVSEFRTPTRV